MIGIKLEIKRRLSGRKLIGKYTPAKKAEDRLINQTTGSPFLKTIVKAAETMPILLKEKTVKNKIETAPKKLALLKLMPKIQTPKNKYIIMLMELKMKSQSEIEIIIVESFVGVTNIASNVPVNCSFLIFAEKLINAKAKYPQRVMPIKTKGKY